MPREKGKQLMADDDILSVEEGWRLYLEERFGDKITTREKLAIARHYTRLKLAPPKLEANRELLRRYKQCEGDIVHGWDDPNDFSWWSPAFKRLAPRSESDGGHSSRRCIVCSRSLSGIVSSLSP